MIVGACMSSSPSLYWHFPRLRSTGTLFFSNIHTHTLLKNLEQIICIHCVNVDFFNLIEQINYFLSWLIDRRQFFFIVSYPWVYLIGLLPMGILVISRCAIQKSLHICGHDYWMTLHTRIGKCYATNFYFCCQKLHQFIF